MLQDEPQYECYHEQIEVRNRDTAYRRVSEVGPSRRKGAHELKIARQQDHERQKNLAHGERGDERVDPHPNDDKTRDDSRYRAGADSDQRTDPRWHARVEVEVDRETERE